MSCRNWIGAIELGYVLDALLGVQHRVLSVQSGDDTLVASAVTARKTSARESHLVVTLTEGKNREARRLCEAVGHDVTRLRRVQIGGLELGSLEPGNWRIVPDGELARAFPGYRARIIE